MAITKEHIGLRIRELRERLGMTQSQFATATGLGHKSISGYELGNSDTSPIFLAKVAELGSTTTDWLITGKGTAGLVSAPAAEDNTIAMPVRALAGAGNPCCIDQLEPIGEIVVQKGYDGPNIQVIQIRGTSMVPVLMNGAHVGIDITDKSIESGQLYAIYIPHEGIVVKRIFIGPELVKIKSDNPTFPEHDMSIDRINWETFVQGRVKWVIQEY